MSRIDLVMWQIFKSVCIPVICILINPLMPNDLQRHHAVSTLKSQTTYKDIANSVSKFGGILFTPVRLTAVAC